MVFQSLKSAGNVYNNVSVLLSLRIYCICKIFPLSKQGLIHITTLKNQESIVNEKKIQNIFFSLTTINDTYDFFNNSNQLNLNCKN